MKKQYYFILPFLLLICFAVLGQNPNIRFYGFPGENSYASTMKQLSNGNLALTYSNSCYSSDGSFPIEGCPLGSGIRLVGASGDTLWMKKLDSGYGYFPNEIMEDANGNITAIWVKSNIIGPCLGFTSIGPWGGNISVPRAFYLNANGTLLSETPYPPQDCSMEFQFTCQLDNGKKLLFTNYDEVLLLNPPLITLKYTLNPDNSVLSTNAITNSFHSGTIVPTSGNTFMVTWRDINNKFFVSEMNANGDFLWSKAADSLNGKQVYSLKVCPNGDLLVLQGRYPVNQQTNNVILTRLDSDGNFLWQKSYDGRWFDMSMDVRSDNSTLIASAKPLQYPDESELEVRLLNADGEIIEDKVWNISPGGDHPRTILAQPNGDYVVYGTAYLSNLDSINGPVRTFLLTDHADLSSNAEAMVTNPLSIWPNPVRDIIHLPTTLSLTEAEITDGFGRSFGRRSTASHQLSVSDLPAGVYVLRCFGPNDGRVWLSRFVKN
jgi:hypothetical protein